MKYHHAEAFCLMSYACAARHTETLWNTRDGVTPFVIRCPIHQAVMQHVNWQQDACVPNYIPPVGSRVFVDVTFERMLERERTQVAKSWNDPNMQDVLRDYKSQEDAAQCFARQDVERNPGAPDIRVVDEGVLEWLKTHRNQESMAYR